MALDFKPSGVIIKNGVDTDWKFFDDAKGSAMIKSTIRKVANGYIMVVECNNEVHEYCMDDLSKAGDTLTTSLATMRLDGTLERAEKTTSTRLMQEQYRDALMQKMAAQQINPSVYLGQAYAPMNVFGTDKDVV